MYYCFVFLFFGLIKIVDLGFIFVFVIKLLLIIVVFVEFKECVVCVVFIFFKFKDLGLEIIFDIVVNVLFDIFNFSKFVDCNK